MISCGENNTRNSEFGAEADETDDGYSDGIWCADVEYYNPNTRTNNTYELDVVVENSELIKIEWTNGGWLDESHFSAEDISDGNCSFTSDRGYEYTITLKSKGGCGGSGVYQLQNDIEDDEKELTCHECGGKKYSYDDLCGRCERKKRETEEAAETCPNCYGFKMEWERICSSCKEESEQGKDNGNGNF
jgi:hypothetical protein